MPNVKSLTEKEKRDLKITAAIKAAMTVWKKNNEQVAQAMGMGYVTWLRRMKMPGEFRVDELRKLERILPGLEVSI